MSRIQDAIEDAFRDGVNSAKAAGALPPMSIRDWFAGQAVSRVSIGELAQSSADEVATNAYRLADAMLARRAK